MPAVANAPFAVRELTDEEVAGVFGPHGDMRRRLSPRELRERRWRGDRVIGAFAGECLTHVSWMTMTRTIAPEEAGPNRFVQLPREVAYLYHCFTFPPYRRQGAYLAVLREFLSWPGLEGVPRFIACSHQNDASRHAIEKSGFILHTRLNPRNEP